jgi:hypothetical protein
LTGLRSRRGSAGHSLTMMTMTEGLPGGGGMR